MSDFSVVPGVVIESLFLLIMKASFLRASCIFIVLAAAIWFSGSLTFSQFWGLIPQIRGNATGRILPDTDKAKLRWIDPGGQKPSEEGADTRGQQPSDRVFGTKSYDISVSLSEYWLQVEASRQEITELAQIPLDEARLRLEGLSLQWEALISVELPDGRLMAVDHSYLVSLLRSSPPDWPRIEHMFTTLLAEREHLTQGQFTDNDRNSLNRILAQPEFQWKPQNEAQPNAFEKLWQRFQQKLEKLARRILDFEGSNYIFGISAVLFFTAGLLFLLRHLLFGFVAEARLAPSARTGGEVLTADTALKRAQNLSHEGDYRSAVRYLYLSALLLLEERGLLGYDRTKTNREYLRSVVDQPELETPLRNVVEVFDRVWYGYQSLDEQDYQYYERQVEILRQQRQAVQQKAVSE